MDGPGNTTSHRDVTDTDDTVTVREASLPVPSAVFGVVNPVMKALLRSPLHGLVSDALLLVTFTGRKSGREYTTPVGYHELDDPDDPDLLLFNDTGWWRNLRGGAPVTLRVRGETVDATATARPDRTAEYLHRLLADHGPAMHRRLALDIDGDRVPTVEEIRRGLEEKVAIEIEFDENESAAQ